MRKLALIIALASITLFSSCKKEDDPIPNSSNPSGCGTVTGYDGSYSQALGDVEYYLYVMFDGTSSSQKVKVTKGTYLDYNTGDNICF